MKKFLLTGLIVTLTASSIVAATTPAPSSEFLLNSGWQLQSSSQVKDGGEVVSTPQYRPQKWYSVTLPMTVARALVQNKIVPEPYFGMNLRKLPGVTYPIGTNFS